jgi:hypothetical protein
VASSAWSAGSAAERKATFERLDGMLGLAERAAEHARESRRMPGARSSAEALGCSAKRPSGAR